MLASRESIPEGTLQVNPNSANPNTDGESDGSVRSPSFPPLTYLSTRSDGTRPHWQESPFAVGPTKDTWAEERVQCREICPPWSFPQSGVQQSRRFFCTGFFCQKAGRVGNMVVLYQRSEEMRSSNGQSVRRPRLVCLVGPHWPFLFGLTIPLFSFLSVWVALQKLPEHGQVVKITWWLTTVGLFASLFGVACRDPGIMYRHAEAPDQEENWQWNDQALTFRPHNAKYDRECAAVIEQFDHTYSDWQKEYFFLSCVPFVYTGLCSI
jgi:hypothetical protein